ncbi:ABC transporter substrate-binding protein [Shewanella saliphila]|uniref:ABC transporter substrate-binding protein n=2 Tax=Shewanella saliphila TaxID=2282698 RepID=A0ABQ2QA58_9GAMM|nr:ABC transporter substrate-binding protein [Shewanella saliphila]
MFMLSIIACLTSCEPSNNAFTSKALQKPIKIAVSNTPLSAPLFIAQQQGYFDQNNVNVELIRFDGGVKCFDAMVNREADFATSSETVVMFNSFKRTDFSVIASFVESDNDVKLLSLNPQKYKHLDNLANARIGIIKGSSSEFFLDSLLIMYNKTQQPIQRVYLKSDQLLPALLNDKVDIISAWEPLSYLLSTQMSRSPEIINSRGLYHLSFNLIGLKDSHIEKDQKLALLKAINQATEFLNKSPKQAQQNMSQILEVDAQQLQYSWSDYTFRLSLSNALFSNIQTQSQWAIDNQLVPRENRVDFRLIFDRKLLETYTNQEAGW